MLYAWIVFISMSLGDIGSTAKIKFVNDGHRFRACLAEAWSDLAALGSIGVGAVAVYRSGIGTSVMIVMGLICGSILGTYVGQRLADKWELQACQPTTPNKPTTISSTIQLTLRGLAIRTTSILKRTTVKPDEPPGAISVSVSDTKIVETSTENRARFPTRTQRKRD